MNKTITYKNNLLTFKNYKEPLLQIPKKEGFGFYGTLLITTDNQYVQCHICGELFQELSAHVLHGHKINVKEYREKFKLAYKTPLISESLRMKRKMLSLEYFKSLTEEERVEMKEKARIGFLEWKKGEPLRNQPLQTLETKNKRGTCPDQLLDKIKKVKEKLGKVPTLAEFVVECGSQRYKHLIFKVFGSWNNALKMLKYELNPRPVDVKRVHAYTREQLIEYMQLFTRENNKIPSFTDFKAHLLPDYAVYKRVFGNMENARIEAGVYDLLK